MKNLVSLGKAAVRLQVSTERARRAFAAMGAEPEMLINDVEHFLMEDVLRLEQQLLASRSAAGGIGEFGDGTPFNLTQ